MAIADVHGDSLTSDGITLNIAKQKYFISALEGKRAIPAPLNLAWKKDIIVLCWQMNRDF